MSHPRAFHYLDYMATTPLDPIVTRSIIEILESPELYANPASASHRMGFLARERVEAARQQVAQCIKAQPEEIIWTSGATEADNLAIKGVALYHQRQGKHLITVATEHSAVLDSMRSLAQAGFEVTVLTPQRSGLIDLEQLKQALRPDTSLVSVMWVNNETGVVQPIAQICQLVHAHGALLHVDAAQAVGKIAIDVTQIPVDLLSLSAHKVYGPKGVGALYCRGKPRVRIAAQIHGGGHEKGLRSGTLATHQLVGMGAAFAQADAQLERDYQHASALQQCLLQGLQQLPEVFVNGDCANKVPHCVNLRFSGVDNEALLLSLPELALSSSSACHSASQTPSRVLTAMGLTVPEARQAVRISFGRFTTMSDIKRAVLLITSQVERLRGLSPLWDQVRKKISE